MDTKQAQPEMPMADILYRRITEYVRKFSQQPEALPVSAGEFFILCEELRGQLVIERNGKPQTFMGIELAVYGKLPPLPFSRPFVMEVE